MVGVWFALLIFFVSSHGLKEEPLSLCSVFVRPFGYPCSEFTVTTEDGFLVGVQRIPFGARGKVHFTGEPRPAVLLQHGLLQGGDAWFLNQPSESLGFILADAGFDVWVSNGRGTLWSHGHERFMEKDKEFWEWTWDELATYDIPAILEFIHKTTSSRVFYVGHSQGTIIGLAALTLPKVSAMLSGAAMLSPITYLDHITSKFVRAAAFMYIDSVCSTFGLHEFNLYNKLGVELVDRICARQDVDCGDMLAAITGPNCCFNASRIPYYLLYEPQSTSARNMKHLAQMIRRGTFQKFDHGPIGNLRYYGKLRAPMYDLSNIPSSFPLWMAYGGQDALADTADVLRTLQQLSCNPKVVYLDNYGHLDFVLSTRGHQDLYNDMIAFFQSQANAEANVT